MPSSLHTTDILSLPSWRSSRQAQPIHQRRLQSTAQESRLWDDNVVPPAVLHGRNPNPTENNPSKSGERAQASETSKSSRTQSQPSLTSVPHRRSRRGTITTTPTTLTRAKRQAAMSPAPPPAQRARTEAPTELRDEAYIRKHMHVPTLKMYPELPPSLFEHPKESIHNTLQKIAILSSAYTPLARENFGCSVTCRFVDENRVEVVHAQGSSKVIALDLPNFPKH